MPSKYNYPVEFSSLDELSETIINGFDDFYSNIDDQEIISQFDSFVDRIKKTGIPFFCYDENAFELSKDIMFFFTGSFNLPWIWYYPKNNADENYYIKVTVLPEDIINSINNLSVSDAIKTISPSFINVNNYAELDFVDKVEDVIMPLKDRTMHCLRYSFNDDAREWHVFIYDNLLFFVVGNPEVWTEDWFSHFSIGYYEVHS